MYFTEKSEFNAIREKSLEQWLNEMEQHSDLAVRGGVKLTREYVQYLQDEIERLKSENNLKAQYLKKLKMEKMEAQRKQQNQTNQNI